MRPDPPTPGDKLVTPTGSISQAEFGELFRKSHRTLWLIAVGVVHDRTLADDVLQEAALVALGKVREFQAGSNFTAWMASIVRFVALNKGRKERKRRSASLDHAAEQPATSARDDLGPETARRARGELPPDQQMFDDGVMRALGEVGETARACLLLRTIDDMEYSEIAALLDIPAGTAMSHVHRTRQLLRERLVREQTAASGDAA
ncbi:MAG: RNA polymerase sigma factor [Phycisphaerae bacterium]